MVWRAEQSSCNLLGFTVLTTNILYEVLFLKDIGNVFKRLWIYKSYVIDEATDLEKLASVKKKDVGKYSYFLKPGD